MDAFKVQKNGKLLDYRVGETLDLKSVKSFLQKNYKVIRLWQGCRHVLGKVRDEYREYFIKMATTPGISARLETERIWCEEFNKLSINEYYLVPKFYEGGYYKGLYYILIEEYTGPQIAAIDQKYNFIGQYINQIIDFSEFIQDLPLKIPINDAIQSPNHQEWFVEKTKSWLDTIPGEIIKRYKLEQLFDLVKEGANNLSEKAATRRFHSVAYDYY